MLIATLLAMSIQADNPSRFEVRAKDWRIGAVVYQVFVDRFVPPKQPNAKAKLYQTPQRLRQWSDLPTAGKPVPEAGLWSHELDFWGGDLEGIRSKLPYLSNLGCDVLYLTPIHKALTNHKYDAQDYLQISPEFGTKKDFDQLVKSVHTAKMRIVLDGVFNHIGRTSALFQEARSNPKSAKRGWFYFGKEYPAGYRAWANVANLPALNLESKAVQDYLWRSKTSVVRHYLNEGIDGWRLDVAFELGDSAMAGIRKAAHQTKPGSAVIGEINGYPADWFHCVDGVFNFYSMNLAARMARGELEASQYGQMMERLVADAGMDNLLRCWLLTDNHDTNRLATTVKDPAQRRLVQALQFTLPGSPVIYYGSELGIEGAGDPANRAPMRWDLLKSPNADYDWIKALIKIRKSSPALRHGDFRLLATKNIFGFARITDRVRDGAVVLVNPTGKEQTEVTSIRFGKVMSWGDLQDQVSKQRVQSVNGIIEVKMRPRSVMILTPVIGSVYDRTK